MKPQDVLRAYLKNDERNIRDCKRFHPNPSAGDRVVIDCAAHFVQALFLCARGRKDPLAMWAENNLEKALILAGRNITVPS